MNNADIKRLGVLGGTFDPPHYGHLTLADTARVQLRLQRVLFAPAGQPPHKPKNQPSPVVHRLAMVQAALADAAEPAFCLSRVDVDRPGPHYTVDTLSLLRAEYPAAQIWLIVGADSLADLPHWRDPARITALARLAVRARPGYEPNLDYLAARLSPNNTTPPPDLRQSIEWLPGPASNLSSSALRQRARQGLPLRYLTPPSVQVYVHKHGLYGFSTRDLCQDNSCGYE
ncbi:MAG: nicotinate (nicotinamide) nucleotide adenylyltransferase [Delftia sp.]|nr:nicotinate (nicotinamide) nucleotide adenylyltransferase [Delftia sp.]